MQIISFHILTLEGDGFHIIVDTELFGIPFKMVIDTGASKTVLDRTTLIESGIKEHLFQNTDIKSTGLGTNDMESFILDIPELKIQNWSAKNIQVAVLDLSSINYAYEQMGFPRVIGVLGGDILMNYGAVIDYNKSSIKLRDRKKKAKWLSNT